MDIKKTRNYKNLQKLVRDFNEAGDTIFVFYGIDGTEQNRLSFVGNTHVLSETLLNILVDAAEEGTESMAFELAVAVAFAIKNAKQCSEKAEILIDKLFDAIDADTDESPIVESCRQCGSFIECMKKHGFIPDKAKE